MARAGVVPLLLAGGIVGPILFVAVFLVLGFVQPGYDPIKEHVSGLAFTRYGWVQTINFLAGGSLLFGFGTALLAARQGRSVGTGIALVTAGAGLMIAGIYPSDIEHVAGSILTWFGLTGASVAFGVGLQRARRYGPAVGALVAAGFVFVFFWLAGQEWLGDTYIGNVAGLMQRISLITGFAVVLAIGVAARRAQTAAPQR